MPVPPLAWIGFAVLVAFVLALDLGVFHRRSHAVGWREALAWTGVWTALALLFGAGLGVVSGHARAVEFWTAWLIEMSLSLDNVFVIALLFGAFAVPEHQRHRVLFWGVLGAVAMRLGLIAAGTALVARAEWVLWAFGVLLLAAGAKLAFHRGAAPDPGRHFAVRLVRRFVPVTDGYRDGRFLVREGGHTWATPLLVVLVCVECTDLVFALDSIPAVFSVTLDPFVAFTSNVFAVLGLRSLYFLLARAVSAFRWLQPALAAILAFAGAKLLLAHTPWAIGNVTALAVVGSLLAAGVGASLAFPGPRGPGGTATAPPATRASFPGRGPAPAAPARKPVRLVALARRNG